MVGSGGREHAIAWKVLQSDRIEKLYVAPGNGGTREFNIPIDAGDIPGLRDFAKNNKCLTIVGPEAPLAAGIVEEFRSVGLPIFGPTAEQARLETSKVFAKRFMKNHGIPTADYSVFNEAKEAIDYATLKRGRVVVKVDGLAAGKGVFVCSTVDEAESAIQLILEKKAFGKAGDRLVIEERLFGREASFMFLCDGKRALNFGSAVDHKRAYDNDKGPNTGGMGAFSPAPALTSEELSLLSDKVVRPAVIDTGFHGFLYVGLMLDENNSPWVLEFNSRLGDPEAQAILPRLDSDLVGLLYDCESKGGFQEISDLNWSSNCSCTVVMCSEGYPESPKIGDEIKGITKAQSLPRALVFHSGTVVKGESIYTSGGRVLSVTGVGASPSDAAKKAYEAVSLISWRGERHRSDIAS